MTHPDVPRYSQVNKDIRAILQKPGLGWWALFGIAAAGVGLFVVIGQAARGTGITPDSFLAILAESVKKTGAELFVDDEGQVVHLDSPSTESIFNNNDENEA